MSIWPIREACKQDWPLIRKFFKNLDQESRYLYFGAHVSDELLDNLWDKFESRDNDQFFVIESGSKILGVCQVAVFDNQAEISVAVDKKYRNRGIAHALTERAVIWCKTHNIENLMMYCIPNNNIIQKIIHKHDLLPLMLCKPAEAKFMVPAGSLVDHHREWLSHALSVYMTSFKRLYAQ